MGHFINYTTNIFSDLANIPTTLISATENVLWITSLIVCNKGAQPIRFNLKKTRRKGTELELPVRFASTGNLTATYNNGSNGIGATLINNGTLVQLLIDGKNPNVDDRLLIKNQTTTTQNGIYQVVNAGNVSTPWELVRTADYDTVQQIQSGDVINIQDGTSNINTQWILNGNVTAIGTSPINFIANTSNSTFYLTEFSINPYSTVDIIKTIGILTFVFSKKPYINDQLISFTNGYTQIYDCEVVYAQLNELPM